MSDHLTSWDSLPLDAKILIVRTSSIYATMSRTSTTNYRQLSNHPVILKMLLSSDITNKEAVLRIRDYPKQAMFISQPALKPRGTIFQYSVAATYSVTATTQSKKNLKMTSYLCDIVDDFLDIDSAEWTLGNLNMPNVKLSWDPVFQYYLLQKRFPNKILNVTEQIVESFHRDYQFIIEFMNKYKNLYLIYYIAYEFLKMCVYAIDAISLPQEEVLRAIKLLDSRPYPLSDNNKYIEMFNNASKNIETLLRASLTNLVSCLTMRQSTNQPNNN